MIVRSGMVRRRRRAESSEFCSFFWRIDRIARSRPSTRARGLSIPLLGYQRENKAPPLGEETVSHP